MAECFQLPFLQNERYETPKEIVETLEEEFMFKHSGDKGKLEDELRQANEDPKIEVEYTFLPPDNRLQLLSVRATITAESW